MGRSSSREDNWIQTGLIGNNDDIRVGSSREFLGSDDDDYDEEEQQQQQKDDSEESSMIMILSAFEFLVQSEPTDGL